MNTFNDELLRRITELPGVRSAGLDTSLPMSSANSESAFVPEGYTASRGGGISHASFFYTAGDYFRAMGIPLLHGRFFTNADKADARLVAIVNHKLAQHYWPGQNPIGKRVRVGVANLQSPWLTIAGEVANVKEGAPDSISPEQIYQPVEQETAAMGSFGKPSDINGSNIFVTVRTELKPASTEDALLKSIHSLDPQLAVTQMHTMEQAVSESEAPRRFNTFVISAFAIAAVLLAVLGINALIAFTVAMRTHEMAIRLALGAQQRHIYWLVLRSGLTLGVIGCAVGLLGATFSSQLLSSLLFDVKASDPAIFAFAAAGILLLTLLASCLPARRAASVNATQALRSE